MNGNWSRRQYAAAFDIDYGECQKLRENWDRAAQTGMGFAHFSGCQRFTPFRSVERKISTGPPSRGTLMTNVRSLYFLAGAAALCSCRRLRPQSIADRSEAAEKLSVCPLPSESRPTVHAQDRRARRYWFGPATTLRGRVMAEIR
jgi:hypothetical protein